MSASALASVLGHLREGPSRTWSLIITLYGDAVMPRGGRLWLGTLLEIFAALEIGGNVVRTAMSRLAADGWLERNRVGRNSYYQLAEKGRATFDAASSRIYGAHQPEWDGAFRLAVLAGAEREPARAALEAAGYGLLAPGVLVAAAPHGPAPDGTILLHAHTDPASARQLAAQIWPTARLEDGYRRFLAAFAPLAEGLVLPDLQALLARLLLIHEYRRLILRDPLLPDTLLPPAWPGHAARALCATLYGRLLPGSERWLDQHAVNEAGALPPPSEDLRNRFNPAALTGEGQGVPGTLILQNP